MQTLRINKKVGIDGLNPLKCHVQCEAESSTNHSTSDICNANRHMLCRGHIPPDRPEHGTKVNNSSIQKVRKECHDIITNHNNLHHQQIKD